MNIGRKSVKTLARALARGYRWELNRGIQQTLSEEITELLNAVVARELAKARKGKK